jgi:hypothetical protein
MDHTLPGPTPVRGVRLVVGRRKETLSPSGLRLLIDSGEVIHEGETTRDGEGTHYYGTAMFTLDLASLAGRLDGPLDAGRCKRITELLVASPFFRVHLLRLARREVYRRLGTLPLVPLRGEVSTRSEGTRIYVDLDVEVHGVTGGRVSV